MQVVDWVLKQTAKIKDTFNDYKFYVKADPQGQIDSSTTLSLAVYTNRQENAIVACTFRWFKLKNEILTEVPEFKGNSFICEPSDVGSYIQVEIINIDSELSGTAVLQYGPVKLDILLKKSIEGVLASGEGHLKADLILGNSFKECDMRISQDSIKILHSNSNATFKFQYNIGDPTFDILQKDPTKLRITFNSKFQSDTLRFLLEMFGNTQEKIKPNKIDLKFANRKAKDEFIFIMKAFNTKRQLKSSVIINKLERIDFDKESFDFALEIQSLRADLRKLYEINQKQKQEKRIYYDETIKLEQEIQEIIVSYTNIIEGKFKTKEQFEQSFVDFQNKKDQAMNHKYTKIEQENARLKDYIRKKLDGDEKSLDLSYQVLVQPPQDTAKPFSKKKAPFQQIHANQYNFDPILNNLNFSGEQEMLLLEHQPNISQLKSSKANLQSQLNHSMHKIEKMERQIKGYERQNMSAIDNYGDNNKSINKGNLTALQMSTAKVIREKIDLQKKYNYLKEQYQKVKGTKIENNLHDNSAQFKTKYLKNDSILLSKNNENPEFSQEAVKKINILMKQNNQLQIEKEFYQSQVDELSKELTEEKEQKQSIKVKYEKKMNDLYEQIRSLQSNADVLNRSQHLSMEMDDYNEEQNMQLKQQNQFLLSETERLTKMCEKYKDQSRRLKDSSKMQ